MTKGNKRFPILLWGDLIEGGRPVLRRPLAGFRAHECMYAWVYLTEHLAYRRLLELLPAMGPEERGDLLRATDSDLWSRFDRSVVDPHYQLSTAAFVPVAHVACLAAGSGEARPTFVELGSTFFTSKTKFEIVDKIARERFSEWPELQPKWIGIDNSRFMRDTTRVLHGPEAVELVDNYSTVVRTGRFAAFLSRFVPSYAFASSVEFADYLAERFDAAVVEDAYSTTERDVSVFNHGQAEVFFSLPIFLGRLEQSDFDLHVLDAYPDFPAESAPCHVIRYLVVRKGVFTDRTKQYLAGFGLNSSATRASAATLLQQLNASVTLRQWRAVKKAKRESPVWGPTPGLTEALTWNSWIRAGKDRAKRYFAYPGWRRYRLGGATALREIHRALREEKP
jgi:hypothetical protein